MKDYTQAELEDGRPKFSAAHCIEHALRHLYADKKHTLSDVLADGDLTYEELIGTLLLARDMCNQGGDE